MGSAVVVPVGVDHGQFIACDPEADLDIESYGEEATRQGLAAWGGNGGVTIFTASNWTDTEVTVRLSPERPAVPTGDWDHVVEGGLIIRNGRLHVHGPEDTRHQRNVDQPAVRQLLAHRLRPCVRLHERLRR